MTWFRCGGIPQSVLNLPTVSSASGSIATFDTDLTDNLVKCIANIQAVQSGSGTPSPSNPRSISGFSNCVITANSTPITVALGQTVYGGYLNVLSGVLTITQYADDLSNLTWTTRTTGTTNKTLSAQVTYAFPKIANDIFAEQYEYQGRQTSYPSQPDNFDVGIYNYSVIAIESTRQLYLVIPKNDSPSGLVVYNLYTPITVQLSSNQIQTLLGQNNIIADTGDIDVKFLETVGHKIS